MSNDTSNESGSLDAAFASESLEFTHPQKSTTSMEKQSWVHTIVPSHSATGTTEEEKITITTPRDTLISSVLRNATARRKNSSSGQENSSMNDMVNSPPHYKDTDIECIDVMQMVFGKTAVRWYCLLNAFKYIWRCTKKHDGETDCVKKAIWYLRFFIGDDPRNGSSQKTG